MYIVYFKKIEKALICVFISGFMFFVTNVSRAQSISINHSGQAPDSSAILDMQSDKQGILIPRMLKIKRDSIQSPATGLMIYQTDDISGFYFWTGGAWARMSDGQTSTNAHYVGELFGGGIVFYVYDQGNHGLIASLNDIANLLPWSVSNSNVLNCESPDDGVQNTNAIIAALGNNSNYAAGACESYAYGGFLDWYLPSIMELKLLNEVAYIINQKLNTDPDPNTKGFSLTANYWSSTQIGFSEAWHQNFHVGFQYSNNDKSISHHVRPIRRF